MTSIERKYNVKASNKIIIVWYAGMHSLSTPSVEPISFRILQLHTDPQRQFTSAAAVGSHAAASAWFLLWFPFCAGPAESKANHTRVMGSIPAGATQTKDNCTVHEYHVLLINCEIQTFPCLSLCAEFVE